MANETLYQEVSRLVDNASMRRKTLLKSGLQRANIKRRLNICAGILSMVSGFTMYSVVVGFFTDIALQWISIVIIFLSGIITLFVNSYMSDEDISNRHSGANKYLRIREKAVALLIDPSRSSKDVSRNLAKLRAEYYDLDEQYSRYFVRAFPRFIKIKHAIAGKDDESLFGICKGPNTKYIIGQSEAYHQRREDKQTSQEEGTDNRGADKR